MRSGGHLRGSAGRRLHDLLLRILVSVLVDVFVLRPTATQTQAAAMTADGVTEHVEYRPEEPQPCIRQQTWGNVYASAVVNKPKTLKKNIANP